MSIDVNLFHPKLNNVVPLDSGTIVVKVGDTEEGKGEVSLFFMQNSDVSIRLLNLTPDSPIEQIKQFITDLLHQAGFTYYEYERSLTHSGGDVTAYHPSDPEPVSPDDIVWVTGARLVTVYQ